MTTITHDLELGVDDLQKWSRAIVAKRATIVAVVTVILDLAVAHGWVTPDVNHNVLGWVNTAFTLVGTLVAILWVQKDVTPSADPRTDEGVPLVPVTFVKNANAGPADNPQGGGMGAITDQQVAASQSDAGAEAPTSVVDQNPSA